MQGLGMYIREIEPQYEFQRLRRLRRLRRLQRNRRIERKWDVWRPDEWADRDSVAVARVARVRTLISMDGCDVCGQEHARCKGHKMRYDGTPLRPCRKYPVRGQELCHTCDAKERIAYAETLRYGGDAPRPRSLKSGEAAFVRPRERPKSRKGPGPTVDEFGLCSRCNDFHDGCTGHNKSTGSPCNLRPMVGLTVCWKHGGRYPRARAKSERAKREREQAKVLARLPDLIDQHQAEMDEGLARVGLRMDWQKLTPVPIGDDDDD